MRLVLAKEFCQNDKSTLKKTVLKIELRRNRYEGIPGSHKQSLQPSGKRFQVSWVVCQANEHVRVEIIMMKQFCPQDLGNGRLIAYFLPIMKTSEYEQRVTIIKARKLSPW